jgi:hypothetical protein
MARRDYITHPVYKKLRIPAYEVWRWVIGWENYYMTSNWGRWKSVERRVVYRGQRPRTRRILPERILPLNVHGNGYQEVGLSRPGQKHVIRLLHRLVLETWVGPCPRGCEASHLNHLRCDNRLENLCWESHKANIARGCCHGWELDAKREAMLQWATERGITIAEERGDEWGRPCNPRGQAVVKQ